MIRIPVCLSCEHYKAGKCPAHPEGIPDEVMVLKRMDNNECGNGVKYKKK